MSMTDREIVERLRDYGAHLFDDGGVIVYADTAADAIERLISERDQRQSALGVCKDTLNDFAEKCERLTKERDEAIEALKLIASCQINFPGDVVAVARSILSKHEVKP